MNRWLGARAKAYTVRQTIEHQVGREMYGLEILAVIAEEENLKLLPVPRDDPLLGGEDDIYDLARYSLDYQAIIFNKDEPLHQQLLYIAHEMGHHFLHTRPDNCNEDDVDPERFVLTVPYADGRIATYSPYQAQEHEANVFAAELLMPTQRLAEKFDAGQSVYELTSFFQVSKYSIFSQLVNAVLEPPIDFNIILSEHLENVFHWQQLDESQKVACQADGPVQVDAGPGTGKTRTLTSRIEWLITEKYVGPEDIIALTFSNKTTHELINRLRGILPKQHHQVTVSTFHGFGAELLRRYGHLIDLRDDFVILDSVEVEGLLSQNLSKLNLNHFSNPNNPDEFLRRGSFRGNMLDFISRLKQDLITPDKFEAHILKMETDLQPEDVEKYREIAHVYRVYEQLKRDAHVVDYDDLVMLPVQLFESYPDELVSLQAKYPHVLVDEFQDINRANGELIQMLAGKEGEGLWVVGDLRQSIYRWRGASPSYFADFSQKYPNAEPKKLTVNYRSSHEIVTFLNQSTLALDLGSVQVAWQSNRGSVDKSGVRVVMADNENDEHQGVIQAIRQLRDRADYHFRDFAIICRTNNLATEFAEALTDAEIPVLHFGNFYERNEVKDMLAVIDTVANFQGLGWIRLSRILQFPIDRQQAVDIWHQMSEKKQSFPEALKLIANMPNLSSDQRAEIDDLADIFVAYKYQAQANPWLILAEFLFTYGDYLRTLRRNLEQNLPKLLALGQLLNLARSFSQRKIDSDQSRAIAFLDHIRSLVANNDKDIYTPALTDGIDAVHIMTIHKAKGLEYPVVFIPRVSKGVYPPRGRNSIMKMPDNFLSYCEDDIKALEERNCIFVGVSRARDHLFVSRPSQLNNRNSNEADCWGPLQQRAAHYTQWQGFPQQIRSSTDWQERANGKNLTQISVSALRDLDYCPRKFFYRYGLELKALGLRDIYLNFYIAVRETINWIHQGLTDGQDLSWEDVVSSFDSYFAVHMPDEHIHRTWYYQHGLMQLDHFMSQVDVRHTAGTSQYQVSKSIILNGISIVFGIDEISETADGYKVYYHRIGKKKTRGDMRLALYRRILIEEGFESVEILSHSLSDNEITPTMDNDYDKVLNAASEKINYITSGEFPPYVSQKCASCAFFFICPT